MLSALNNLLHSAGPMLVLASASPRRKDLLEQLSLVPDVLCPADIDERPLAAEAPRAYAKRMACEKARKVQTQHPNAFILAADTVVYCGNRILPKAETLEQAEFCLNLLSGRRHRVVTGHCLITPSTELYRPSETIVQFKRLSTEDKKRYLESQEWIGKAGGYAIQGRASAFIPFLSGSYTSVVGLCLPSVSQLISGQNLPLQNKVL